MKGSFLPLTDVEERQSVYLQDLGYQCAVLEEQLRTVAEGLQATQRAVIEEYIALRDTKEVESVQAALRLAEQRGRKKAKSAKKDFTLW